jgi:PhzF family phenazine biosynthesis protein
VKSADAGAGSSSVRRALVWLYASFASNFGGGNPAGVVLSSQRIASRTAQATAAMLGAPTTGFVLLDNAAASGSAGVRFFTPEQEIDACGHVSIAIATALAESGIWHWGREARVRAAGGEFPLRLGDRCVEMEQRRQTVEPASIDWSDVKAALGPVRPRPELPLAVAATGLRHLIVPLADVAALTEVTLDRGLITALARRSAVDTICVWARTAERSRIRIRDLCAPIGAVEEAASGTTAGALGLYLATHGQLDGPELSIDQGVEMGRPSRIEVVVSSAEVVTVRGEALRLLTGTLELPSVTLV